MVVVGAGVVVVVVVVEVVVVVNLLALQSGQSEFDPILIWVRGQAIVFTFT